ncbi:MAG: bifunctional heptose 7-phosphate kinase/heptose 1-phosphate adenyltransferase [Alphaproteobacteria bacterium]
MTNNILNLLDKISGCKVAVIGDLVADVFIYGHTRRISREAPVLILEHESEKMAPGGAANAAHNVVALGGEAYIVGVVGEDRDGETLVEYLAEKGVNTDFLVRDAQRPTTTKRRIVASGLHTSYQQMLRIDRGFRTPVAAESESKLLEAIDKVAGICQVIIVSDYGYGVFSEDVLTRVSAIGQSDWCKVLVDSRHRMLQYKGSYLLTPNEPEAAEACHMEIETDEDVINAAERLLFGANADAVALTRGNRGMYLLEWGKSGRSLPIYGTDEIADVTGAGDTVISAFALATAAGANLYDAACLATVSAGLVVLKQGTATVTQREVRAALEANPWPES